MADGRWRWPMADGDAADGDGRWQMADGRWQMADGRWQMADGRWQMADGRWQMADGRWQMADGRWQMADGRWQMADGRFQYTWHLARPAFSLAALTDVMVKRTFVTLRAGNVMVVAPSCVVQRTHRHCRVVAGIREGATENRIIEVWTIRRARRC